MIRRSPTRIELKLEDLNDFEYIQKSEKRKNPSGSANIMAGDSQKLLRQERIGLPYRPLRSAAALGLGGGAAGGNHSQGSLGSGMTSILGAGASSGSDIAVVPATPTNLDNSLSGLLEPNATNTSIDIEEDSRLGVAAGEERVGLPVNIATNNSNMSLDESL